MKFAFLAAALLGAIVSGQPATAHEFKLGDIEIIHPWARETPPNAATGAGYMTIRNHGAEPERLVSVSAEFAMPQLHESAMEGDVMRMRELDGGIVIPPGGEIEFAPGGNHVMFMGLAGPFVEGERRKVTLSFENAGTIEVEFVVQKTGGEADHSGHGAMN